MSHSLNKSYSDSEEKKFLELHEKIISCHACPRLVEWREKIAQEKVARFSGQVYWGKPLPGFGDINARLLIVGLAPAAHGGNRTGRVFTGDKSGDWLYRALHKAGFANQSLSVSLDDGLILNNCYIVAVVRCAPPENKPTHQETLSCLPYLEEEISFLKNLSVIITLGKFAFDNFLTVMKIPPSKNLIFGHNVFYKLSSGQILISSYHPSQRNTSTKLLTEPMFDAVFANAKQKL